MDPTILPALNEICYTQASLTLNTTSKCNQLLDYLFTHPNATLRFYKSDMCLHIDTDALYLVAPEAKSCIAGYYYLSNNYTPTKPPTPLHPKLNTPLHVECKTLKHVVSSAAEAETGGVYSNCTDAIPICNMLKALGHPQGPTSIKTDIQTAASFIHNTLKSKRS